MNKLKINMYAGGLKVKGQGVGANFFEQVNLVKKIDSLDISINSKKPKKFDINHFHTVNPSFYFKFKKKKINVCYVHFIPDENDGSLKMPKWMFKIYKWYVFKFYRKADECIVVNPYYINDLVNKVGINREKITYIPNYVSNEKFYKYDEAKISSLKDQYNINKDKFIVLGVGQTQTRKGIFDFVEVAKKNPDILFVWAGGFSFGKLTDGYEKIKNIIENPPANVKFLGIIPREKMNDVYNLADMLFLPSYQELFPMTLLECINIEIPFLVRDLDLYKDIFLSPYLVGKNNDEFSDLINKLRNDRDFNSLARSYSLQIKNFYNENNVKKLWEDYYFRIYNKYPEKHNIKIFNYFFYAFTFFKFQWGDFYTIFGKSIEF